MPCAKYWKRSYHLVAQLSRLLLINFWQWRLSYASLETWEGLKRSYICLTASSPFSKHGMEAPLDEYIILTSIKILFWCFRTALKPLNNKKVTGKGTIEISWNKMTHSRLTLTHIPSATWMDNLFIIPLLFLASSTRRTQNLCERSCHCDAARCCRCVCLWPEGSTWLNYRQPSSLKIFILPMPILQQNITRNTPLSLFVCRNLSSIVFWGYRKW